MRKLLSISAIMGLAVGISTLSARADGVVAYEVTGTFAMVTGSASTALSVPGDTFKFTFSVDPAQVVFPQPPNTTSNPLGITFNYTLFLDHTTMPVLSLSDQVGTLFFVTPGSPDVGGGGGLLEIDFSHAGGAFFLPLFNVNVSGFDTLNGGSFPITDGDTTGTAPPPLGSGSILGEIDLTTSAVSMDAVVSGTVTATPTTAVPEPSSLLLLGSGFLALGGFARRRVITLFN